MSTTITTEVCHGSGPCSIRTTGPRGCSSADTDDPAPQTSAADFAGRSSHRVSGRASPDCIPYNGDPSHSGRTASVS